MRFALGVSIVLVFLMSCAGGEGVGQFGNEGGSQPINPTEERDYKRAVLKCYKTGGSRVVKMEGLLRCF